VIADEAIYFEQAPFPPEADGTGPSLHRVAAARSGNDPANWLALPGTPGLVSNVLAIANLAATGITPNAATLNGTLLSTAGEDPVVHIYWGSTDAGTNAAGWEHDVNLGLQGVGDFSAAISGLTPGAAYWFRCFAQTSSESVWAGETAQFDAALNNYTLTITAANGTVSRNPDQPQYVEGTDVTLTAQPAGGFIFAAWLGDVPAGHEMDNPLVLSMDGDKTLSAVFVIGEPSSAVSSSWMLY
jgi:hypothetical protein